MRGLYCVCVGGGFYFPWEHLTYPHVVPLEFCIFFPLSRGEMMRVYYVGDASLSFSEIRWRGGEGGRKGKGSFGARRGEIGLRLWRGSLLLACLLGS